MTDHEERSQYSTGWIPNPNPPPPIEFATHQANDLCPADMFTPGPGVTILEAKFLRPVQVIGTEPPYTVNYLFGEGEEKPVAIQITADFPDDGSFSISGNGGSFVNLGEPMGTAILVIRKLPPFTLSD